MPCPLAPTPRCDAGLRPIKIHRSSPHRRLRLHLAAHKPVPPASNPLPHTSPLAPLPPTARKSRRNAIPTRRAIPAATDTNNDGNQVDDDSVAEGDGGGDVEGNGDGDAEGSGEGDTTADAEGDDSGDAAAVTTRRQGRRQARATCRTAITASSLRRARAATTPSRDAYTNTDDCCAPDVYACRVPFTATALGSHTSHLGHCHAPQSPQSIGGDSCYGKGVPNTRGDDDGQRRQAMLTGDDDRQQWRAITTGDDGGR
ncbi:hypothetical protein EDB84DRAFT_1437080 [Lactarius hengduanensis]|nr:hypothetical protein EDB84DRAFT_1437080 [Lactarius hengduanensis]